MNSYLSFQISRLQILICQSPMYPFRDIIVISFNLAKNNTVTTRGYKHRENKHS